MNNMPAAPYIKDMVEQKNLSAWPFPVLDFNLEDFLNTMDFSMTDQLNGISYLHCFDFNNLKAGGCTIAYRKESNKRVGRMVEVALAYCAPGDVYTRKIGVALARARFLEGRTLVVPARSHNDDDTIKLHLRNMFYHSVVL